MRRLRILTWHTHGSYLYYLSHLPHDWYVLSRPGRPPGYGGRTGAVARAANVHDLPASEARHVPFDCILFQDDPQWHRDQYELLSPAQRALPRIYLEHDPPRAHPVDEAHPVHDPKVLVVHVTAYNALMWNNGTNPVRVIEHGVAIPAGVHYTGELARGLVVTNQLAQRGRRVGADLVAQARHHVPLDLIGMGSAPLGGLGEVAHPRVPAFAARYRFLFSPLRYTSMGLAVIEAMLAGVPVVALATTGMAGVVEHGVSGFASTAPAQLTEAMQLLLADLPLARRLGEAGRARAAERYAIGRFCRDWEQALRTVTGIA